jgi:hypothetical protein
MKLKTLIFFTSLLLIQVATAETDAEREADKLLSTIGMEQAMVQSMEQMLNLQLQQNPLLAPYKTVMIEFFNKHMSWESLKPEFIKIYAQAFSGDELREITDFYRTEVGSKTIKLMPTLMAQGGQIGASRVQANIGELEAMIQAEAERLQK